MNHRPILCGFWPQSEVFSPRASKACICEDWFGIFIFLKYLLFSSEGPTRDHSADIFRGHVPRASVAKGEGQWRV